MKRESTRLPAQTLLPNVRLASRNQSASKISAAAPESRNSRHKKLRHSPSLRSRCSPRQRGGRQLTGASSTTE